MNFILTTLFLISFGFTGTEGLKMDLILDRDTVYVADPNFSIFLTIRNTFQSSKKVLDVSSYEKMELAKDRGDGLKDIIVSQTGETLNLTLEQWIDYPAPFPDYLVTLSPNESIVTLLHSGLHLTSYYGGGLKNSMGKLYDWPVRGLSPGVYRIKAVWRDFSSNEVKLVVKNPGGKLAEAYDLYLEAWSQSQTVDSKTQEKPSVEEKIQGEIERLSATIFKFENKDYNLDPYAPMTFDLLYHKLKIYTALLKKPPKISSAVVFKKIVENYPNSQVAKWRIARPSLDKKLVFQSEEEYQNYLKYLTERYPGTLVGNEAKRIIESKKEN